VNLEDPPARLEAPQGTPPERAEPVLLNWDQAVDDEGHLRRCPVCGCPELFTRKDFPQVTGFVIVVLAAVAAMILFGMRHAIAGLLVLGIVAVVDLVIFGFAGRCLVCYRCRSEFRGMPISHHHQGWDLATGEKYQP